MKRLDAVAAPDFAMTGTQGTTVRLSQFLGEKRVVLAFLRGFA